jgi:hypothetical protein
MTLAIKSSWGSDWLSRRSACPARQGAAGIGDHFGRLLILDSLAVPVLAVPETASHRTSRPVDPGGLPVSGGPRFGLW